MAQLASTRSRHKREKKRGFSSRLLAPLVSWLKLLTAKLKLIKQISNERHTLSGLNDHLLEDIGLTRDQVKAELSRGIFDLPPSHSSDIRSLQGGLRDSRCSRVTRIPED